MRKLWSLEGGLLMDCRGTYTPLLVPAPPSIHLQTLHSLKPSRLSRADITTISPTSEQPNGVQTNSSILINCLVWRKLPVLNGLRGTGGIIRPREDCSMAERERERGIERVWGRRRGWIGIWSGEEEDRRREIEFCSFSPSLDPEIIPVYVASFRNICRARWFPSSYGLLLLGVLGV